MRVEILCGVAAERSLSDPGFKSAWADLARACPWGTVFQSPAFAATWYRAYRERCEPVLVMGRDDEGRLVGLLPLARGAGRRGLRVAGKHQAEYQGWICTPAMASAFPPAAFDAVRGQFPSASLQFRYMPAGLPLNWMESNPTCGAMLNQTFRRPLMRLGDGAEVEESLRKSGNKSRLRQLKKFGPIEFVRVTDPAEFGPLLDEVAQCHDCRQLAIHGCAPFADDPLKHAFHLAMMTEPGLLHVTALKVGNRPISFQLNVTRGRELQLYLIAHNPQFAAFSPGKLHLLFLARMLVKEGFEQIDLTPGGDAYKERFANAADEVHRLAVYPTVARRRLAALVAEGERIARKRLERFDLTPADLRCFMSEWHGRFRSLPGMLGQAMLNRFGIVEPVEVYARDASCVGQPGSASSVRRDDLSELLRYRPDAGLPPRRRFVSEALRRIEEGQRLYTLGGENALAGWAFLSDPDQTTGPVHGFVIPPSAVAVTGLRVPDEASIPLLLDPIARDAAAAGAGRVYLFVPIRARLGNVLRDAGFRRAERELEVAIPARVRPAGPPPQPASADAPSEFPVSIARAAPRRASHTHAA